MPLSKIENAKEIITQGEEEMNKKARKEKGGNKMKKLIMAILVVIVLVNTTSAFAYWKSPVGLEIKDPAPNPFNENKF